MNTLKTNGGGGFFSCCSVRLFQIVEYINKYNLDPHVDSTDQFIEYKPNSEKHNDISQHFFNFDKNIKIPYPIKITTSKKELQFSDYKLINFSQVKPVIDKYFYPSDKIINTINFLEKKYNFNYENLLTIYYRSTDKRIETNIPSFKEIINKTTEILEKHPHLQILYVTDDTKTISEMQKKFKNVIIINELEDNYKRGYKHAIIFFSCVIIMSKSNSIITTSGNVSNWMIFYRTHSNNIYQYLSEKKYIYGKLTADYNEKKPNFWL